jgi:hypothetical protein
MLKSLGAVYETTISGSKHVKVLIYKHYVNL